MNAKPEWHHFDYVSRNIFVHCTLEGLGGKSKQADLILDTGMNRSSVSPALAFELGLPSAGTTNSRAPGGSIVQNMALLHKISLAHYSASELKVTVDSMADYATDLYGRKVDGFLGADFFAGRIVSLDFDQHLLSLDAPAITDGVLLEIEATPFSGLLLVPVTLSNNLTMLELLTRAQMTMPISDSMKMLYMELSFISLTCRKRMMQRASLSPFGTGILDQSNLGA
jgi:hypothetical protein